jgi:hypothetical protein
MLKVFAQMVCLRNGQCLINHQIEFGIQTMPKPAHLDTTNGFDLAVVLEFLLYFFDESSGLMLRPLFVV